MSIRRRVAVRADGEAVGLVAQALDEIEHRVARLEHERLAAGPVERLAAGVAVRPLGDADERQVGDAELGEHRLAAAASWPLPPSMKTRSGHGGAGRLVLRRRPRPRAARLP